MSAPLRILYVDDYPDDATLAVAALLRDGVEHEAVVVETMQEAAALVLREPFSAVVSDYTLGAGSALELLRAIRAAGRTVPFIVLSGTIGEERAAEIIREGASDYVMKDRIGRLAAVIRRELAAVEARKARAALEERLRRAEERYRRTFEEAPIGIANVSPDGCLISVNHELCRLLGYGEQELIGRAYVELIDPEERAEVLQRIDALLAGADVQIRRSVRRYRRMDGSEMWGNTTVSMLRNASGAIDCFVACVEDVTSQKAAQEKVLLQARLLECVEQAVIATDLTGTVIYWNGSAERLYGWSASEAIGRRVMDLTPAAGTSDRAGEIIDTLRRGDTFTGEIVLRRRDGTTFPAFVTDAPIFDDSGATIGIVGLSYDLTGQKRVESELREHKVQLAEAQEIAQVGSWTYDFATGQRTWSESMGRLLGAAPGTALRIEDLLARVHPEDLARVLAAKQRLYATLEPASIDFRVCTESGIRVFSVHARVELNASGEPLRVVAVMQDVSDVKAIEEELRRRTAQQTAVANLGQIALSGAPAQVVLDQAAFLARTLLEADLAEVFQCVEDRFALAAGDGWEEGDIGFTKPPEHCQATFTIEMNTPVVVENVAVETRFAQSAVFAAKGIVSGVMVVINTADGMPWGVLGVHSTAQRTFADYDVEFLRSMASVLGQAIARDQADAELRQRARQQSAIASFGRLVLNSVDTLVLDRVAEILVDGIDADFGFIVELMPDGMLRKVAGRVWTSLPDQLPVDPSTQVGYTVLTGEPVIVDDYRTDTRFDTYDKTVPYGILSGVMVPVMSPRRTFGVLAAQSRRAGHFRVEHIDFLQALANILSEALEREQARLGIEESELRYRRIFEGATEIIFALDTEGRFVRLNPAFTAITGWTCEEWIGRPYEELLVPEDRERTRRLFHGILAVGNGTSAETTLLGRDCALIMDVQSFPKIENGVVTEIYGFARDVTDARVAAAERERVTRNLELILESTIEGICTIDVHGNCTMINRAAAAFLGAAPEELLGSPIHDLLHARNADGSPREGDDCPILAVLRGREAMSVSSDTFSRLDGTPAPVSYSVAAIVDGGRLLGAVVTFTDLTEQRQLEAKLEQATRLSSLGRLAATVAHEFNNVLMGIAPFVQIIERATSREKIAFALDHISTSVKRGRRVTEDILRFTQPGEPALTSVDVDVWLQSVAAEGRQMIGPRYELTVHSFPLAIAADASQLHQVFMNLILNARDAMPGGGSIHISAREERSDARFAFGVVSDPARFVHFTVCDTGCGMSEETLRHAFEPLFTTKKKGTGLGLAVTHQVVQRHGGEIFIESEPGNGTTFHVFIPHAARTEVVATDGAVEQPNDAGHSRLLLVEDDPAVAAGLATLLECEGFDVSIAGTGEEALELIRRGCPDAVILDVGLPDMDGRTVFAGIAGLYPRLPVVFSTGHSDRSQLEEYVSHPHVGYLMKPYDGAALIDELTRAMAGEG